jgi:hypothetical protein
MRVASPQKQKIVPAFTVEKLSGTVTRTIHGWDGKGEKTTKEVKVDAGYMVRFPVKGHSLHIRDDKELARLEFDQTIPLVDANSDDDDAVGEIPNYIKA